LFKCKICSYSCSENYSGTHIKRKHQLSGKEYYDKYLREAQEGFALFAKETNYFTIKRGYKECCSVACANKLKNIRLKEGLVVDNLFQLESVKTFALLMLCSIT